MLLNSMAGFEVGWGIKLETLHRQLNVNYLKLSLNVILVQKVWVS